MLSLDGQSFTRNILTRCKLRCKRRWHRTTSRGQKLEPLLIAFHNLVTFLMQQAMVMSAQQHQIVEPRLAAITPVLHIMRVHVAGFAATWKTATLIADLESTSN